MVVHEVIIAHDYSTQRGGAERVALALASMYPRTPFITALYDPDASYPGYLDVNVKPSFLNKVKAFRRNPQVALPLLHYAWTLRKRISAGAVLVSSSGWAHAVKVTPSTAKIVYCHNPPRWVYQPDEYLMGRSRGVQIVLATLRPLLRLWDQKAAKSVDIYLANSASVAARIKAAYGREAQVIHPPVTIDPQGEQARPAGVPDRFFLTIGRLRGYKGTADIVAAFGRVPGEQLVVVGGDTAIQTSNVTVLNGISDSELRWLYRHATALLSVSKEDFGLTPIEANAFGTPALLVRAGGFLDSLQEGISGLYFDEVSINGIARSVLSFPREWDAAKIRAHAQQFSMQEFERKIKQLVLRLAEEARSCEEPRQNANKRRRRVA